MGIYCVLQRMLIARKDEASFDLLPRVARHAATTRSGADKVLQYLKGLAGERRGPHTEESTTTCATRR
jgi:hypothetical protein